MIRVYHFVYIYVAFLHYGSFYIFKHTYDGKSIVYQDHIHSIFFLCGIFHIFNKTCKDTKLELKTAFINIFIVWAIRNLQSEPGNTENFYITYAHKYFLQCQFVDAFPMKWENQQSV